MIDTVRELIVLTTSPEFSLHFKILFILLKYSFPFILSLLTLSRSKIPKYLYPSFFSNALIAFPFGRSTPSFFANRPHSISTIAHFRNPNSMPMPSLITFAVWTRESISFTSFTWSFRLSTNNRWLICPLVFPSYLYPVFVSFKIIVMDISANKNSICDRLWISLLIFIFSSVSPPDVNSDVYVFIDFSTVFLTITATPNQFIHCMINEYWTIS